MKTKTDMTRRGRMEEALAPMSKLRTAMLSSMAAVITMAASVGAEVPLGFGASASASPTYSATPPTGPGRPSQQLEFHDDTPGAVVYSILVTGPNQHGDTPAPQCIPTPGRVTQKANWWWSGRTNVDTFYSANCTGAHATAHLWFDVDPTTQWRCLSDVAPYRDWSCSGATPLVATAAGDITSRTFPSLHGGALAQQCASDPNCTVADFAAMSPDDRIAWLDAFQSMYNTAGWFNNVRGVLNAFKDENKIRGSNWYSYVDAATLEAINSGHAMAFGLTPRQELPGSADWASFFKAQLAFGSVQVKKAAWGKAEYASIHGADANVLANGIPRDLGAVAFTRYGDYYRVALQTGDTRALRNATASLFATNDSAFTMGEWVVGGSFLSDDQLLNPTDERIAYQGTKIALQCIAFEGSP